MAPRPSSPTSLLWAHQLKREHAYLLERIKTLETANVQLKENLQVVEERNTAVTSANENISKLAALLEPVEGANDKLIQRLEKLESSLKDATEDAKCTLRRLQKKVEGIDSISIEIRNDQANAKAAHALALQRISEVEELQRKQKAANREFGSEDDLTDVRALNWRIKRLETERKEDAMKFKEMQDKLSALEKTNQHTTQAYERSAPRTGTAARYERVEQNKQIQTPQLLSSGRSIHITSSPLAQKTSRRIADNSCTTPRPPPRANRLSDVRTRLNRNTAYLVHPRRSIRLAHSKPATNGLGTPLPQAVGPGHSACSIPMNLPKKRRVGTSPRKVSRRTKRRNISLEPLTHEN